MLSRVILVVDSELHQRHLLRMALEQARYRVITASSVFETLSHLVDPSLPDLVIVGDLVPRPETSLGLVNDIRVAFAGQHLPMIMVSDQTESGDVICGLAGGADLYVAKLFNPEQVVEMVDMLIKRRRAA